MEVPAEQHRSAEHLKKQTDNRLLITEKIRHSSNLSRHKAVDPLEIPAVDLLEVLAEVLLPEVPAGDLLQQVLLKQQSTQILL